MSTTESGRSGEEAALNFLKKKGMRLLERNYRFGHKEIDLIMRDKKFIVFVEVKARSSSYYGTPGAAVTSRKQELLIKAAEGYLMVHSLSDAPARFDVVEVALPEGTVTGHIENAFGLN